MRIHGSPRIWVGLGKQNQKTAIFWGRGLRNESPARVYGQQVGFGGYFGEKRFGFGFGFPVMGWIEFGPEILPLEGL